MQPILTTPEWERQEAVAFLAELIWLQREVSEMNRQLDRIEIEMRTCINELDASRFEEYR